MKTNRKGRKLVDEKVNTKTTLALLWAALMFLYIYNDIFSLFQPGHVADLVEGKLEGVVFTQTILFGAAALMAFPSIMILISLNLKARANRLVNIIVAVFHIFVLLSTQLVGEGKAWIYWRFNEVLEALFLGIIIWTAWRWPAEENQL